MITDPNRKILLVDDDEDFLVAMRVMLKKNYGVLTAASLADAMSLLERQDVDLVLLDVGLGGENGLNGIKKIKNVHPSVGVAMLSGQRDVKVVVDAIRAGAIDYLTKPLDMDELAAVMEKAVMARFNQERCEGLFRSQMNGRLSRVKIVYKSQIMQHLIDEAERITGHNANVLIIGETGTGKELLARYINERDGGGKRPFVAVNCAALPEHLLESELFGHEAGAFTGAARRRIGKFELADGGDILLDEISTMRLDLQVKLLRVLQEKEFCRLGSNSPIKTNFRVISACNQSLEELVEKGNFRMDLYHRLRVIQFVVPPLRDRVEDIPLLIEHFLDKFSSAGQKKQFTATAMARLMEYPWQGNVRELANVVQSMVIMTRSEIIDESAFPSWVMNNCHTPASTSGVMQSFALPNTAAQVASLDEYVRRAEKHCIDHVLKLHDGDKSKTALALNIGRTTLYMKMKELGMME